MLRPETALSILHYSEDGRLKLAFGEDTIRSLDDSGARLTYSLELGASAVGAPCFDADLNLVAVHLGQGGVGGYGALMNAIAEDLRQSGYDLGGAQAMAL